MSTLRTWPSADLVARLSAGTLKDTDACPACDCPAGVHRREYDREQADVFPLQSWPERFVCPPLTSDPELRAQEIARYHDMVIVANRQADSAVAAAARISWRQREEDRIRRESDARIDKLLMKPLPVFVSRGWKPKRRKQAAREKKRPADESRDTVRKRHYSFED